MTDEYDDETFRWWHLSGPSPELLGALEAGWMGQPGRVVDLGCGLGSELGHLASLGWSCVGTDVSASALRQARQAQAAVGFVRADARALPFPADVFDAALDRGCFHYLRPDDRAAYLEEVRRVLRPGGRFLLRACLRSAGEPNSVTMDTLMSLLPAWRVVDLRQEPIPSDTREMPALVARLERSGFSPDNTRASQS